MKVLQIIPELLVEDMPKTVRFYESVLGFKPEIIFSEKKPVFAQVGREGIHIMLYKRSEFEKEIPKLKKVPMGGSVLIYIEAEKLEKFYCRLKNKINVIQPLHKTDYGTLEFTMEDCNGYLICFSERIPK